VAEADRRARRAAHDLELAGSLENVWAGLHDVKKALVVASDEASKQTAALVKWTKVLAWATGGLMLLTGGLLLEAVWSHLASK